MKKRVIINNISLFDYFNNSLFDTLALSSSCTSVLFIAVDKLKKKVFQLEEERNRLSTNVHDMESQCAALSTQVTNMSQLVEERIPREEHEASVRECERYEDIRNAYCPWNFNYENMAHFYPQT